MGIKHQAIGNRLTRAMWESDDLHELDGRSTADIIIVSVPPRGMCRIVNIYYDPEEDKAIFEYDDQPVRR